MRPLLVLALAGVAACAPGTRPRGVTAPAAIAAESPPAVAAPPVIVRPDAPAAPPEATVAQAGSRTGAPATDTPTAAEIARRATEVFGAPADASSGIDAGPAADEPSWDIAVTPYESHARVEHYIRRYTGPARAWVTERLARGTRYEPMIRDRLRAAGLPEDMYYLAFVESGFDTHAYSRAAAVGMWQFMATTGKGMGLRVDWWMDERRDPVRATSAAVRFLSSLNDQFGSLYLAAAAYNGGPSRVARGLTRFASAIEGSEGEDRYFALSEQDFLPRETKEYVPQIIAAALIGNDPGRYGIEVEQREVFAYDSVRVPSLTSLPAVARAAGTDIARIRDLNPQFLRGLTPPRVESQVRIPVGSRARFDSAFAALPAKERVGVRRERVETSGSLATIARRFRTSQRGITGFNPNLKRTPKRNIAAGQTLFIPTSEVAAAALDVPDPSIERYGPRNRTHVVRKGETLGHIARRYDTSVATVMRLNRLKKPLILIGQELAVPSK